jgi:hypothetical protein
VLGSVTTDRAINGIPQTLVMHQQTDNRISPQETIGKTADLCTTPPTVPSSVASASIDGRHSRALPPVR